jgi:hypothetical protein
MKKIANMAKRKKGRTGFGWILCAVSSTRVKIAGISEFFRITALPFV